MKRLAIINVFLCFCGMFVAAAVHVALAIFLFGIVGAFNCLILSRDTEQ